MLWQEAQNPGKGNTCKKSHVVYRTNTYICTCKLRNCYFHFILCLIWAISPNRSSYLSYLTSKKQSKLRYIGKFSNCFSQLLKCLLIIFKDTTTGYLCKSMFLKGHYRKREDAKPHPLQESNWERSTESRGEELNRCQD